jgi:DNA-binding transcriptional regulator GbsR (MarR family)
MTETRGGSHKTEIQTSAAVPLSPAVEKFVRHWGEMGTRWGINRTVAGIFALLYTSRRPLNSEEIAETLDVARSNVSTSLRELQGWGVVKVVHVRGDRRDHFETLRDPWEIFRSVLEERKRRECDPTLQVLHECVAEARRPGAEDDEFSRRRLEAMLEFFATLGSWYEQIRRLPTETLVNLVRLGDNVCRVLGGRQ